jgi:hypothetical protein
MFRNQYNGLDEGIHWFLLKVVVYRLHVGSTKVKGCNGIDQLTECVERSKEMIGCDAFFCAACLLGRSGGKRPEVVD